MEAMIHVMQGIALCGQNRTYEALTAFNQAVRLAPNLATVQYYRGYGLQRQHHLAQAQAAFAKAAQVGQGDVRKDAEEALRQL